MESGIPNVVSSDAVPRRHRDVPWRSIKTQVRGPVIWFLLFALLDFSVFNGFLNVDTVFSGTWVLFSNYKEINLVICIEIRTWKATIMKPETKSNEAGQ